MSKEDQEKGAETKQSWFARNKTATIVLGAILLAILFVGLLGNVDMFPCPQCEGSGKDPGVTSRKVVDPRCSTCNGSGHVNFFDKMIRKERTTSS